MQSNGVLRNHHSTVQLSSANGIISHSNGSVSNGHGINGISSSTCDSFHSQTEVLMSGDSSTHLNGSGGIDRWERKPLLNHDRSGEETTQWPYAKEPHLHSHKDFYNEGVVQITLPAPEREEPKFPKEKLKTFLAFVFLCANSMLTTISLSIVHERIPDRNKYPPLPDVVFDLVAPVDWGLAVSEVLIIVSTFVCCVVLFLHKYRFIILRRVFLLLGLLYLMRGITMFVTQVPVASVTYYCSPKANSTSPFLILRRALRLMSGFGLSINGKHTYCGDYIYSGHTAVLTLSYLIIKEYTPRRCYLLHWLSWLTSMVGVVMILISRGHYTVDVLIAYYITTRLFWMYHVMANNTNLKVSNANNFLARLWWFSIFQYFEGNVGGVVPRQYEWPLPWPRRFTKHDRNS